MQGFFFPGRGVVGGGFLDGKYVFLISSSGDIFLKYINKLIHIYHMHSQLKDPIDEFFDPVFFGWLF